MRLFIVRGSMVMAMCATSFAQYDLFQSQFGAPENRNGTKLSNAVLHLYELPSSTPAVK